MQVFDLPEPDLRPLALALSPDGALLAGCSRDQVFVLDALSGATVTAIDVNEASIHPGVASTIGFAAGGRAVVFRTLSAPWVGLRPLDHDGPPVLGSPKGHGFALDVTPSGAMYLTHDSAGQFQIRRWDPLGGKLAHGPHGVGYVRLMAVSADERWVAGAGSGNVRVWNWGGGDPPARAARQFKTVSAPQVDALALSADGAFLAMRGPGVMLGAVNDGEVWTITHNARHDGRDVAFHRARPVLAYTAGRDEAVFYDVAVRTELTRFAWGIGPLRAVCFSPDGLRCAAAGNGKVVVWDVDL